MSKISKVLLGDLINFQRGFDLPKNQFIKGIYPVISSNGILGYHNEYKVKGPGITIGRSGTVGIPHYIKSDFYPHNTSLFIEDFKGNNRKYIYYLLKNLQLDKRKSGSGVPTMNRNHLHPLVVSAVTSAIDQEKIAKSLSVIDQKIELNNRINTELEAMAKTLYDYWFVQFDFPDKNGKPYKSSGGKMVYNAKLKRDIPDGWSNTTIESIENNIVTGKTPSKKSPEYFNGKVPFITISDIRGNTFITSTEETLSIIGAETQKNKYLPEGTICVTCIASPGLVGFTANKSQTNQQINSIICSKEYNRYFLYFSIKNYFKVAKAKTGNTFANMNKKDFSDIILIKPPKTLLELYHKKVTYIFENMKVRSLENNRLQILRDWLLPMLMNGQVTVK